jgi:uncharacterized protein (TIGR03083 family)
VTTDKAKILTDLDAAWDALRTLVDSVPEDRLEESGVVEEWSVKDLLGHMAFWAEKASDDLKALDAGKENVIETPGGDAGVNQWNAREAAARKGNSLGELRDEWLGSFTQARAAFEAVPAGKLEIEVKGWPQLQRFLGDTTIHYREHEDHIRTWLNQLETIEA